MDVKEIMAKVEEQMKDASFQKELKKDPVKAVEKLVGVKIPADQIKTVEAFVKTKLGAESLKEADEKLGDVKGIIGGLMGKKE